MTDSRDESEGLRFVNALPTEEARVAFLHACGANAFADAMTAARPYASLEALVAKGRAVWAGLSRADWDEAFRAHPEIGGSKAEGPQTAVSAKWSSGEQAKVGDASSDVRAELQRVNAEYKAKFGRIYIVCATGRSAEELLAIAKGRLANDPESEVAIAAAEQSKITDLRLEKLVFGRK